MKKILILILSFLLVGCSTQTPTAKNPTYTSDPDLNYYKSRILEENNDRVRDYIIENKIYDDYLKLIGLTVDDLTITTYNNSVTVSSDYHEKPIYNIDLTFDGKVKAVETNLFYSTSLTYEKKGEIKTIDLNYKFNLDESWFVLDNKVDHFEVGYHNEQDAFIPAVDGDGIAEPTVFTVNLHYEMVKVYEQCLPIAYDINQKELELIPFLLSILAEKEEIDLTNLGNSCFIDHSQTNDINHIYESFGQLCINQEGDLYFNAFDNNYYSALNNLNYKVLTSYKLNAIDRTFINSQNLIFFVTTDGKIIGVDLNVLAKKGELNIVNTFEHPDKIKSILRTTPIINGYVFTVLTEKGKTNYLFSDGSIIENASSLYESSQKSDQWIKRYLDLVLYNFYKNRNYLPAFDALTDEELYYATSTLSAYLPGYSLKYTPNSFTFDQDILNELAEKVFNVAEVKPLESDYYYFSSDPKIVEAEYKINSKGNQILVDATMIEHLSKYYKYNYDYIITLECDETSCAIIKIENK